MEKNYGVVYKDSYSIEEIYDMVYVTDVKYWYRKATYEQPKEEDIDYNPHIVDEFKSAINYFEVEFENDDDENGKYLIIDDQKYMLVAPWYECLKCLGYSFFEESILQDLYSSEKEVRDAIDTWIADEAYKKAWEVIEN